MGPTGVPTERLTFPRLAQLYSAWDDYATATFNMNRHNVIVIACEMFTLNTMADGTVAASVSTYISTAAMYSVCCAPATEALAFSAAPQQRNSCG